MIAATGPQGHDVRDRGRVLPHLRMHCGRHHERGAAGEHRGSEQVVGDAGGELRDRVRGRRRDHQDVRLLAEPDVAHGRDVVEDRRVQWLPADRLPRRSADEPQRGVRRDHPHRVAGEHQITHDLDGLVCGDTAGDTHDDVQ